MKKQLLFLLIISNIASCSSDITSLAVTLDILSISKTTLDQIKARNQTSAHVPDEQTQAMIDAYAKKVHDERAAAQAAKTKFFREGVTDWKRSTSTVETYTDIRYKQRGPTLTEAIAINKLKSKLREELLEKIEERENKKLMEELTRLEKLEVIEVIE